jgi:hypothetical protein
LPGRGAYFEILVFAYNLPARRGVGFSRGFAKRGQPFLTNNKSFLGVGI